MNTLTTIPTATQHTPLAARTHPLRDGRDHDPAQRDARSIHQPVVPAVTAFVGVNQWLYVTLRGCPASIVLKRVGVASQCKW